MNKTDMGFFLVAKVFEGEEGDGVCGSILLGTVGRGLPGGPRDAMDNSSRLNVCTSLVWGIVV